MLVVSQFIHRHWLSGCARCVVEVVSMAEEFPANQVGGSCTRNFSKVYWHVMKKENFGRWYSKWLTLYGGVIIL